MEDAAAGKATAIALDADLPELAALVESTLLANIPAALGAVMNSLRERAALSSDTGLLMDAAPPLANVSRYGNVRQHDTEIIGTVLAGIVSRICVGLAAACASLNDDSAQEMRQRIESVDAAVRLVQNEEKLREWTRAPGVKITLHPPFFIPTEDKTIDIHIASIHIT